MTMILIQYSDNDSTRGSSSSGSSGSGSSSEVVVPLTDFLATSCSSDHIVLNEVAAMLLLLLVEGDQKLVTHIVSAFHGVEEYAAFVLFHLVHQPCEELRCTGIRLLTHLYLRIHSVSSSTLGLSLKRGKRIASRIGLLSVSYQGLQRYRLCMYVCVYVCMYACMYVCFCVYVCVYVCMASFVYVCMYV